MYIDSHAHLNFKEYKGDIKDVLRRSFNAGVKTIINVGSNYQTSQHAISVIEEKWDFQETPGNQRAENVPDVEMYAIVGCHPIHLVSDITESAEFEGKEYKFTTKKEEFDAEKYQKLIDSSNQVVGVGETGLDFYRLDDKSKLQNPNVKLQIKFKAQISNEKNIQKQVFKKHIKLAIDNSLPLVLHCRGSKDKPYGAYDEMIEILISDRSKARENKLGNHAKIRGVIHCFTGNLRQAREFIKLGFYVGINGIVTFKNSKELQKIVKIIPLEKILLETDCPFLAPDPYRGKRNEPAYIPIIAQKIAELKDVSIKEVEKQTTENAKRLFEI